MAEPVAAESEVDRLRAKVESYRQRELESVHAQLAAAREEAAHYRLEAQRNAEVGRQIDREYRKQLEELRAKLQTYTNPAFVPGPRQTHAARN